MNVNQPLRTLYLIRQHVRLAKRSARPVRSSIEGHFWPSPPPEDVRDALDTLDVYLDSIETMCDRYEPFRGES